MKIDRKKELELISELESAYQKVYVKEAQLKEHGQRDGDGTARYQTMSDVRDSETRYRRLFETAKDGILILDAETGAITDANPFITESLGFSLKELTGKRLWEIGAFVDVKDSKDAFEELQRKEYIRYEDLPLRTKQGQSRQVEFVSNVYLVNGKRIIQCNIRDITDRKLAEQSNVRAEEAMRESEERYRRLFETAQDGILILDAGSGTITDANPFIVKLLGYVLEDLIGKRLWEIGAFADVKDNKAAFEELQRKEYIRYDDLPLKTKEGQSRQVEFVSNVYLVNGKNVIQCNIRDITERKQVEKTLVQLAAIVESSDDAIIGQTLDGTIASWNLAAQRLYGYSAEEAIGHSIFLILQNEEHELTLKLIERLRGGEHSGHFETVRVGKYGQSIHISAIISTITDKDGKMVGISMIERDNSAQKKAEEILAQIPLLEKDRNRIKVYKEISMIIAIGLLIFVSEIYFNFFEHFVESFLYFNSTVLDVDVLLLVFLWLVLSGFYFSYRRWKETEVIGKQRQKILDALRTLSDEMEVRIQERTADLAKSNTKLRTEFMERKQSEELLLESDERFSNAFKHAPIGIALVSPDGKWLKVNKALCELVGYSESELLLRTFQDITYPEDLGVDLENLRRMIAGEIFSYQMEKRYIHKQGHLITVLLNVSLARNSQGEPRYFISQIQDITERKRAEVALHESNVQFHTLFEASPDAILLIDPQNNWPIVNCNTAACRMNGYTRDELIGQSVDMLNLVQGSPTERMEYLAKIRKTGTLRMDAFHRRKDGSAFPIETSTSLIILGEREMLLGIDRDITERKRAENDLRESNEKFHQLADNITDAFWIRSPDMHDVHYISPAFERIWGRSVESLYANPQEWSEFILPEDRERVLGGFAALTEDMPSLDIEYRIMRPDGDVRWVRVRGFQVRDTAEKLVRHIGIVTDITEIKQTQAIMIREKNFADSMLSSLPGLFYLLDKDANFLRWNTNLEKMSGYSAAEIANLSPLDLFHGRDKVYIAGQLRRVFETGEAQAEAHLVSKSGVKTPYHFSGVKILFNDQPAFIGVGTDITERKRSDHALRKSDERFRSYFELGLIGMAITSPAKGWIEVNDEMCRMLGYERHELLQLTWAELTHPDDLSADLANFNRVIEGEIESYSMNKRFIRKDGKVIDTTISAKCLRRADGMVDYFVVLMQDITERKRGEISLMETSALLETLLQNTTDRIYFKDMQSRFVHFSRKMLEIFLLTDSEQLKGKTDFNFFSDEHARPAFETEQEIIHTGKPVFNLEEKETHLDGRVRWVLSSKMRWRDKAGNLLGTMGISRDITDRKHTEVHLRESEERYRRLVEFSPSAIMVHSFGKFVYVNPAAVKLLGAHDELELLGKPIVNFHHQDHRESALLRVTTGIMENKILPLMKEKFLRLDGTSIDVEVTSLQIEYNGIPAMQDVVRDITEQKKLQQQLVQSQKSESIGTLAGGIAHDFNNILAIILGYTYIIGKKNADPKMMSESVAAINQAVKRGASLVRQILTFARKTEISFEPLHLADLIQEIVSMLQQTFPKIIRFNEMFSQDIPFILADRTQIHQAILNLCVNARDAMPNGGTITIKTDMQTGDQLKKQFPAVDQEMYVCITVTDTGEGMDETTRSRVFDPFFTTKPQGKGTGLGLSVVYGVVQSHKGFINVESELEKGTSFRLYFPIPGTIVKMTDLKQEKSFEEGGTETILIVEDEKLLQETLRSLLESSGYTILVANDGAEAIEVYKEHRQEISLVLTDLGLPVMTGMEEFKLLKKINPDVKVIFASGFFDPDVRSELLKAGGKNFLQKPYMTEEILKIVRETLDKKNR